MINERWESNALDPRDQSPIPSKWRRLGDNRAGVPADPVESCGCGELTKMPTVAEDLGAGRAAGELETVDGGPPCVPSRQLPPRRRLHSSSSNSKGRPAS